MKPFSYLRVDDAEHAVAATGRFIAGGTGLIDLMKLGVEKPDTLVDISGLPYTDVEVHDGGARIGALARNTDVAYHPLIAQKYPVLAEALLAGASPQLRNMATVGGNLMQRTRCSYFRDLAAPCNKRAPGTGCAAWDGANRMHAILGGSAHCIATHPSDMCVALVALDAVVRVRGPAGERTIPIAEFHVMPGDQPEVETALRQGELVTHVDLPEAPFAARSHYLKVRDRASYAFALASAAVALELVGGRVRSARIALGGVGTKPWRSLEAEAVLTGKAPGAKLWAAAAEAAVTNASPRKHNVYKVALARRTLARALEEVTS